MTGELVHVEQLAPAERSRLAELEQVVDAGLQTFVDVGAALLEIRRQGGDVAVARWCHERSVPWAVAELAMEVAACR